jgi:hypothetical protein
VEDQASFALTAILANRPAATIPPVIARQFTNLLGTSWVVDGFRMELAHFLDLHRARIRWEGASSFPARVVTAAGEILGRLTGGRDALFLDLMRGWHLPARGDVHPQCWKTARRVSERSWWWDTPLRVDPLSMTSFMCREADAATRLQLVLVQSAIHAWRNARGRLPGDLSVLAPGLVSREVLTDKYSGKPFRYAVTKDGRGFTLSSAGVCGDGLDSKGKSLLEVHEPLPPPPPTDRPRAIMSVPIRSDHP